MKIAMIGHKRIPGRAGGIEIVVNELSTRMAALGNEVTAYNRNCGEEKISEYKGVKIVEVKTSKKSSLNALVYSFFAVMKAVRKKFDVIHFHAEGPCAMIGVAHMFGIPTVATIHGLDWARAKWGGFATKYLLYGEKTAAKRADEIIVLSENMQDYFRKTYDRKTNLIPNGVNKAERVPADLIKQEFNLKERSYILFVARITPEKGLHYLIDAYKKLNTDKKLVIVGRTDPETEYIKSIKKSVVGNENVILTGFRKGRILKELFSNCFLYVLPSDLEGMPVSLLEAISFRARCLTSNIPECTEVAPKYVHTFKKGDAADLKKELECIIKNEDLYAVNFGKNAAADETEAEIDALIGKYDWDEVTKQTLSLYEKAIDRHKKKH